MGQEQQKRRRIAGELPSEVSSPKSELNSLIGKIAKKVLAKGDTLYVCNQLLRRAKCACDCVEDRRSIPGRCFRKRST